MNINYENEHILNFGWITAKIQNIVITSKERSIDWTTYQTVDLLADFAKLSSRCELTYKA